VSRRGRLIAAAAPLVVILAVSGCGSGASGSSNSETTPAVRLLVALTGSPVHHVRIVGGTPAMRAQALRIVHGMGGVAISEIRFGHAPATFGQFRHVRGPDWIFTTVVSPGDPVRGGLFAELAGDGALWQASVFDSAFVATRPAGQPRVDGTSEAFLVNGRAEAFSGELASDVTADEASPPAPIARSTVVAAAAEGRFAVVRITFIHPHRLAGTVIVRASGKHRFAQRLAVFERRLGRLTERMDGLQWEIVDRCGTPVAIESVGSWTNARWLCPNPAYLGFGPSPAACRKLARKLPRC
jgi:hypothetical protein